MKGRTWRRIGLILAVSLLQLLIAAPLFSGGAKEEAPAAAAVGVTDAREAPMLAEMVARGELPPLEERLPAEPFVLRPLESVGRYGGTLERMTLAGGYAGKKNRDLGEGLMEFSMDGSGELVPNVAKSWEMNTDATVLTFHLREGIRWSDGKPYDTSDVQWVWDNVLNNKELTPGILPFFRDGDGTAKLTVIDRYTFSITFSSPRPMFFEQFGSNMVFTVTPPQFMEQYHKDHADPDELAAAVREAGLDSWFQLFQAKNARFHTVGFPVLGPYVTASDPLGSVTVFERNPYYWKVDPDGRQLPYIDRWEYLNMEDREVMKLKGIAGDVDIFIHWFDRTNWPVVRREATRNDYKVISLPFPINGGQPVFFFHYGLVEPRLDELLHNVEFRRALSLAVDRDEVNQIAYSGMTTTYQAIVNEEHPAWDHSLATAYTEYDPERASAMLDAIGLTRKDSEGYRLYPNGDRITLIMNSNVNLPDDTAIVERNLRKVGLYAIGDIVEYSTWAERRMSPDFAFSFGGITGGMNPLAAIWPYYPVHTAATWAGVYMQYYTTDGAEGVDPRSVPGMEGMARLADIYEEATTSLDPDRRLELIRQSMEILVENMYRVGITQYSTVPGMAKNYVKNVPDVIQYSSDFPHGRYLRPEQWWLDK